MRKRSLADQRESEMREWREIAARADASLLRNRRVQARIEHGDEQLRKVGARAGVAFGDHVRAQQHHRTNLALGEQWTDAGGVTSHEVDLELGEALLWDRDFGQLSETGRDAVGNCIARDEIVDDSASSARPLARHRSQFHRRITGGHGKDILDPE